MKFKLVFAVFLTSFLTAQDLPTFTSELFTGSGDCALCHENGAPNDGALISNDGVDVAPPTGWRSTMMANSSRDPLWRAKVASEVFRHPDYQEVIEDKCTTCHAPMARTEALYNGAQSYSMEQMVSDSLASDGVSCAVCHQIQPENLDSPESFTGHYEITDDHIIFGPYEDVFEMPMQNMVGYWPEYSPHIETSELCATCHTLFTPTIDSEGNVIGSFPEQTPYLEWQNSQYPELEIECQSCHMPRIDEDIIISNRPPFLDGQSPFGLHDFVGGNYKMISMIKEYGDDLGVTAENTHFDSTLVKTMQQLAGSMELNGQLDLSNNDDPVLAVQITNLTGHKIPTGFPSRRIWLEVTITDQLDTVLYSNGNWDPETGEIYNLDFPYETHRDQINSQDQVQVYEAIMGDEFSDVTYTLLSASQYLKDNRIPPLGFGMNEMVSDTIAPAGNVLTDENFNLLDGQQGTGSDWVYYHLPEEALAAGEHILINVWYQTMTPRFYNDLVTDDLPEVNQFESYLNAQQNLPVLIKSLTIGIESDCFLAGDLNLDQSVDVLDVLVLVNIVLEGGDFDENICADLNYDNQLDVLDIIQLVAAILA